MIRVSILGVLAYVALLCLGAVSLSPLDVFAALTGGGTPQAVNVVWDLRLPVAIVTAVAGASLATAGAWSTTVARNPLASPDMLGISGGAAVAVVAFPVSSFWERALLALSGAVLFLLLLLVLSIRRSVQQLILIGVALALFSQAAVSYLLLRADLMRATEAQVWLAGSTSFARWPVVLPLVLGVLPFVVLGLFQHRSLPILAHDDATAISLGVPVARVRLLLVIAATGIVAVVVSVVGPLAFVALVAPQLSRMMGGGVLLSAIWGATLMMVCAVAAVLLPVTAPVGLLTSAIGGVMLVYLVVSRRTSWSS